MIKFFIILIFNIINIFLEPVSNGLDFATLSAILSAAIVQLKVPLAYVFFFLEPSTILVLVGFGSTIIFIRIFFAIVNLIYP